MKTISVTDLKRIPELSHLRMIDFIDPRNDRLVAPYLKVLGFDLDYPIEYMARQHRNLAGEVVIAYMIAGEVECNERFLSGPFATAEDRIIAAGYKDLGLAKQMSSALSTSRNYDAGVVEGFSPELTNPDEAAILEQLQVLDNLLEQVRPNRYKEDGSLKTIVEYHTPEPEVVPKKERKKRSVAI
jgi:hypothetical protein